MDYQHPLEFESLLEKYKSLPVRRNVLEIGSMVGDTLRCWMDHGEWNRMKLVSVDKIVPPNDHRHAIQKRGHEKDWPEYAAKRGINLTVIDGYSQMPETIAKVKAALGGEQLDFLFIDGGHDYPTVKADFENYSPLVKPGGLVAFHDMVGIADVAKYWAEVSEGRDNIEVYSHPPSGWGIGCFTMPAPHAKPVLHIITPCKRPENLEAIGNSMLDAFHAHEFDIEWWIVVDGSKGNALLPEVLNQLPKSSFIKIHQLITDPSLQSLAGKGQINFALDQIGDNDAGWVWVLDDDNAVHPDFFEVLEVGIAPPATALGYAFGQDTCNGKIRHVAASEMKELGIDQAQFVIRRDFIGDDRYVMSYSGDGEFPAAK